MRGRTNGDLRPEVRRALEKIRIAENAYNHRRIEDVVLAHSIDCQWRCRVEFLWGREQIRAHLSRKWRRELDGRAISELWAVDGDRVAIRFAHEFHDDSSTWFRAFGNETWELGPGGLIRRCFASINERVIREHERLLSWPEGDRPADHPSLSDLVL